MSKCDNCKKPITKSFSGIECGRCEKIVHLTTKCSGLTNKQIVAVKAAPSLEWTCLDCQHKSPKRKSSIVIPEEDDEEDATVQINHNKLLNNITKEIERAIKNEMRELNEALHFHSAKLDEVIECIDAFKQTIKVLERKKLELTNKNVNLGIRVGALEQRLQEIEQEKLANCIEISNLPYQYTEQENKVVETVAIKLKQPIEAIKSVKKLPGKKDQPAKIMVEFKNECLREKWITAAKSSKIVVSDVNLSEIKNFNTVFIREAMTHHNKNILWQAKQELKSGQNYKYVWFKNGSVKVRKEDGSKIYSLRTLEDLHALKSHTNSV